PLRGDPRGGADRDLALDPQTDEGRALSPARNTPGMPTFGWHDFGKHPRTMMSMRTLFLALLFAPFALRAQEPAESLVKWTDLETAQKAAKQDGKPLLIDVHTRWCGPCRMLDKNTFHDPQTAAYINSHYHPVKFNAEGG